MLLYQHNMEELIRQNTKAKAEIQNLLSKSKDLEQYKDKQTIIRTLVIHFEEVPEDEPLPEGIKNELRTRIQKDLEFLKGQPILKIIPDMDSAPQTLKHLYKKLHTDVQDKNYVVTISTVIVVYGELRIWVQAEEYQGT